MLFKHALAAVFSALLTCIPASAAGVGWSYEVVVDPTTLNSGSDPSVGLTGLSGVGSGTAQVGVLQVSTFGVGFPGGGNFDPTVQLFDVFFTLKDLASDESEVLTFHGGVGGVIDELGANLQFGFSAPSTQSVTLGGTSYEVTLPPFSLTQDAFEGGPQAEDLPTIVAEVSVLSDDTPPTEPEPTPEPLPLDTPEPATLTLASLGVSALSLAAWRRGRGRRSA